jgi:tRNA1Val (adenine37-N6)-methyltransferase
MGNDYFRFKEFVVRQAGCAMKVGTDGALLGTWAGVDGCRRILDVGTGTGLIALMLAQRSPVAKVDAIDIDGGACRQAAENVAASPFAGRIDVVHESLADYAAGCGVKYDLVASNPPYFVRSLQNPGLGRRVARHADSLPLEELVAAGADLLTADGRLAVILPAGREAELVAAGSAVGLDLARLTRVFSVPGTAKRILAELSASVVRPCATEDLLVEESQGIYSAAFVELLRDFYLDF